MRFRRFAVCAIAFALAGCDAEPVEKPPTRAELAGIYSPTKETRAALSALAGAVPRWEPATIELLPTGDYKTDHVPTLEPSFFVYHREVSGAGRWRIEKRGPQVFVVLDTSIESDLLLYRTPTGYALGAQVSGDLILMFAR